MRLVMIPVVVLVGVLGAGCSESPADYWLADSLVKTFPDAAPPQGGARTATLWVARNGHSSIQLAIRPRADLQAFALSVNAGGNPSLTVTAGWVGTVPVKANTPDSPADELIRHAPADFPDPLFPRVPSQLAAGRTSTLWLSVAVPAAIPPGDYPVELRLSEAGETFGTAQVTVNVTAARVPDRKRLRVTNWFDPSREHLARYYDLDGDPEAYWTLLENIGRVMARYGQNTMLTPILDLVRVEWKNGKYEFDFAEFDRWVETFEQAGLLGTVEGGHLLTRSKGYFSPVVVPAWIDENGTMVLRQLEPQDPRAARWLEAFLPALYAHLQERGLASRYIQHLHDEPHGDEIAIYERFAQILKKSMPGIPMVDAVDLKEDTGFLSRYLEIWVPVLSSFDERLQVLEAHREVGGHTWFYTCIVPQGRYLNRFLDYSLLKVRLLHWFNYRHQLSGFLHWGGNYWSEDPFGNVEPVINDGRTLLPAGDNALVYPDRETLSIIPSIRLVQMLEGIEDYELLAELAETDPEQARALAVRAIPEINDYIRDEQEFRDLHRELLTAAGR